MGNNTIKNITRILAFLGDCTVLLVCMFISMKLYGVYDDDFNGVFLRYSFVFMCFMIFDFIMFELYSLKAENVYNVLISVEIATIVTYVISFIVCYVLRFQRQIGMFWTTLFIFLLVGTMLWRMFFSILKKKTAEKRKMLIIENMNNTSRLARKLKYSSNEENSSWYHMIDEDAEEEIDVLLNEVMLEFDIIFISPHISKKLALEILYKAQSLGKEANILANVDAVTTLRGDIYQIDDTPVIIKKGIHLTRQQRFVKRCFDIAFSLVMSIITLPVFAICTIAIKLDSPGPVFYKQERYTKNKKVFNVYKFRTMVVDAEKDGAQFAVDNDPRITRVGGVLRALRLDELPQIYNILSGTMSVVGPRPERPVFADEFSKCVESYDLRYCLKAGLTGYAQVYGRYNTRVSDKILMDIVYGTTYSFLLDIKLIMLTVKTMFIKSATDGVDEEYDSALISKENELLRREATLKFIDGYKNGNKNDN